MSYAARRYPRAARMKQIAWVLHRSNLVGGLTTHQIAFWLSIRPSGHLRGLLREMEKLGWVMSAEKHHRPGIEKRVYEITISGRRLLHRDLELERLF